MHEEVEDILAVDLLMSYLVAEGVEYIFGVPGAALTPLYEALIGHRSIKHILAKHEEGAAFMAAGFARVRRKLGVCFATTGPGGTNALTGIACAMADSAPVLLITGQASTRFFGKGALQESTMFGVDMVQIYRPVTKLSTVVTSAERMRETLQGAIRTALTGRPGPVHLSLPVDILKQKVSGVMLAPHQYRVKSRPVDRAAVAEAAKVLSKAARPCIFAGDGVAISGASAELLELAETFHIPVATTPKGKGVFPENHELSLGVFGFGGHPRAEAYLLADYVDVLVMVGTSAGELATHAWEKNLRPSTALIHVDIDPEQLGKNYPIDVGVVGDARAALSELAEQMRALHPEGGALPRNPLQNLRDEVQRHVGTEYRDAPQSPLKPQRVIDEMYAVLPENALIFVDNGNVIIWFGHYFEARAPGTCFLTLGLASMGNAVAAAVGGKLGAPDRPVVALVGDAAFGMNGLEVHTAADYGIPVIWIVLNNHGHGMVHHGEKMIWGEDLGACAFKVRLDIAGVAESLGARVFRVDTPDSFRDALEKALEHRGPSVIEAAIDPEEVPYPLARRASSVAKSMADMPPSTLIPKWPR